MTFQKVYVKHKNKREGEGAVCLRTSSTPLVYAAELSAANCKNGTRDKKKATALLTAFITALLTALITALPTALITAQIEACRCTDFNYIM